MIRILIGRTLSTKPVLSLPLSSRSLLSWPFFGHPLLSHSLWLLLALQFPLAVCAQEDKAQAEQAQNHPMNNERRSITACAGIQQLS